MKSRVIAIGCLLALTLTVCGRRRVERTSEAVPAAAPPVAAPVAQKRTATASYSVQWVSNNAPNKMARGATVPVQVVVRNTGDWPWPDPKTANPGDASGGYAVRLGYAWKKENGGKSEHAPPRADLGAPVPPGSSATFTIDVTAPKEPGGYDLELDLVEELVTWFNAKGAPKLRIPVTVN